MLILERPWTSQPQAPTAIASIYRRGLGFVCVGSNYTFNAANGNWASTVSSRVSRGTTPKGTSALISDTGSTSLNLLWGSQSANFMAGAKESTALLVFQSLNTTYAPHIFGSWNVGGVNHWLVQANGTGLVWIPAQDGAGNRRRWDATGLFTQDKTHILMLIWRGGAVAEMWLDGINRTAALSAVNAVATEVNTAEATSLHVGAYSSAGQNLLMNFVLAAAWNRALPTAELAQQPWQLFAPRRTPIPTPAAATVPTLSASTYVPGSMTSTGWRPQITAS